MNIRAAPERARYTYTVCATSTRRDTLGFANDFLRSSRHENEIGSTTAANYRNLRVFPAIRAAAPWPGVSLHARRLPVGCPVSFCGNRMRRQREIARRVHEKIRERTYVRARLANETPRFDEPDGHIFDGFHGENL